MSFRTAARAQLLWRTALATLGNEGWELVSAVNEDTTATNPMGLTYLFKRQVR